MVVYLKEGSQIVDLLNVMEAYVSLMNLENVRILKEMRNSVNRKVNCETANINKTVNAAVKQMEDIKRIRDTIGFDNIPEPLAEIAQARLDYPEATLKELGTYLDPPVGKSGGITDYGNLPQLQKILYKGELRMSQKLLFIFNPHAGKGQIKNHLVDIVDMMVKAGFDVTIYTTQAQADATRKVVEEGAGYDRIVCSGGDGTLDEVMTGLMQAKLHIPIGYIPAGSTNDFANSLGIPKEMLKAAERAVGQNRFPCDIGDFNSDTFVYVAAFGLFTEVSYKTSQQLKNIFGHVAYIMEGVKQLRDIPSFRMQVEYDGKVFQDEFIYGMVTNSVSVGGFKGMTGNDVKLDDGLFEVTLIRNPKNPIELNEILACLTNMIDDSDLIYSFKTDAVHIMAKEEVSWTLDGEFGGAHREVVIRNLKQRVEIFC